MSATRRSAEAGIQGRSSRPESVRPGPGRGGRRGGQVDPRQLELFAAPDQPTFDFSADTPDGGHGWKA